MSFDTFVSRVSAAGLKLAVIGGVALAILVGMAGDLAAWPVSIIPLVPPLVWFFFTVVCAVTCMAATTLLGFLSDQSVRGELHWKRLLLFLMVLSAGCLVTAICHVPGAFLQMTQRLPHAPQTVTPEVTTPSPYPQEPTRLGRSAFCWVAKAVMNRPAQELPSEFYGTVTSPKG